MEARQETAEIILAYENRGERLDFLLERWAAFTSLPTRDRALVRQTVITYVTRRRTVKFLVEKVSSRKVRNISSNLWAAICVGVTQGLFLDRIPPHAAVSEAVAVARSWVGRQAGGFANAILRKLMMSCSRTEEEFIPASNTIPLSGGRTLKLQKEWLPHPDKQLEQYLGIAFSQQDWFIRELIRQMGKKRIFSILAALNEESPIFVSVNGAKVLPGDYDSLFDHGKAHKTSINGVYRLQRSGDITDTKPFRDGAVFAQDISQAKVVRKISAEKFDNIIDVCGAPGGKTLGVLAMAGRDVFLVSCDVSYAKVTRLKASLERCGFRSDRCVVVDGVNLRSAFRRDFDCALVDAPCSNTGVLRRRVDARWRISRAALEKLAALQLELAGSAADILKRGGLLIYSTCSILKNENEDVVAELVRKKGLIVIAQEMIYPGDDDGDGAFVAVLGKPG